MKKVIQRFVVGSKSMGDLIYNLLQIQTSKYQIGYQWVMWNYKLLLSSEIPFDQHGG